MSKGGIITGKKLIIGSTYTLRESCKAEPTSSLASKSERELILEKGGKFKIDAIANKRAVGKDCGRRMVFDVVGYYFPPDGKKPVRVRVMNKILAKAIK